MSRPFPAQACVLSVDCEAFAPMSGARAFYSSQALVQPQAQAERLKLGDVVTPGSYLGGREASARWYGGNCASRYIMHTYERNDASKTNKGFRIATTRLQANNDHMVAVRVQAGHLASFA